MKPVRERFVIQNKNLTELREKLVPVLADVVEKFLVESLELADYSLQKLSQIRVALHKGLIARFGELFSQSGH